MSGAREIIGYADGEPIYGDPVGRDALALERREDRRRSEGDQVVYFVQAEHGGPIKIGWSAFPSARLVSLQESSPYRLRFTRLIRGGTRRDEQALHARFAAAKLSGEWFAPIAELCELANARADVGEPVWHEGFTTADKQSVRGRDEKKAAEKRYTDTLQAQRLYYAARKARGLRGPN